MSGLRTAVTGISCKLEVLFLYSHRKMLNHATNLSISAKFWKFLVDFHTIYRTNLHNNPYFKRKGLLGWQCHISAGFLRINPLGIPLFPSVLVPLSTSVSSVGSSSPLVGLPKKKSPFFNQVADVHRHLLNSWTRWLSTMCGHDLPFICWARNVSPYMKFSIGALSQQFSPMS